MSLDPLTAYLVTTVFTLLNGAVLGFIHPALPKDLQPSSADWRVGTLLFAVSTMLFVAHGASQAAWLLPLANGALLFGVALYLRSGRRYVGRPDRVWVFLPALAGVAGLVFYTLVYPQFTSRVVISSFAVFAYVVANVYVLYNYRRAHHSISSAVLIGLMVVAALLLLARVIYFLRVDNVVDITQTGNMVNVLTPILIAAIPVVGTTAFALLCFERIRSDLHRVATTDALTGLPNRRTIAERAMDAFEIARAEQRDFALAVIDIDHFKRINDSFGHDAGDHVLRRVSELLAQNVRGQHVVGRQGGEEFVALFIGADLHGAQAAAERLRSAIENNDIEIGGITYKVTLSIGVASMQPTDDDYDDVLRRADRALYRAKAEGRNCVR